MYYRGANAALLLYDITSAATFEDVRGWLEGELILPINLPRSHQKLYGLSQS
jgi:GTPase SAR1 family protein